MASESDLPQEEEEEMKALKALDRHESIYSMTLDELQSSVLGKPYFSMNMDEFLNNVWEADDAAANFTPADSLAEKPSDDAVKLPDRQNSLLRQGSFTLPIPLSGKTVEEVWSAIRRGEEVHEKQAAIAVAGGGAKQATFGEMTLEDFLVKAGIVREARFPAVTGAAACAAASCGGGPVTSEFPHQINHLGVVSHVGYPSFPTVQLPRHDANGGYYAAGGRPFTLSPVSPLSSDGVCAAVGEVGCGSFRNGRKRIFEGPVEKVVERRQRRMIKNRESAARSRARKQAYTVELEAELNQLKEENSRIKTEMDKLTVKFDEMAKARERAEKALEAEADRKRKLKRVNSWHGC